MRLLLNVVIVILWMSGLACWEVTLGYDEEMKAVTPMSEAYGCGDNEYRH